MKNFIPIKDIFWKLKNSGTPQNEIAKRAGISNSFVTEIMQGKKTGERKYWTIIDNLGLSREDVFIQTISLTKQQPQPITKQMANPNPSNAPPLPSGTEVIIGIFDKMAANLAELNLRITKIEEVMTGHIRKYAPNDDGEPFKDGSSPLGEPRRWDGSERRRKKVR